MSKIGQIDGLHPNANSYVVLESYGRVHADYRAFAALPKHIHIKPIAFGRLADLGKTIDEWSEMVLAVDIGKFIAPEDIIDRKDKIDALEANGSVAPIDIRRMREQLHKDAGFEVQPTEVERESVYIKEMLTTSPIHRCYDGQGRSMYNLMGHREVYCTFCEKASADREHKAAVEALNWALYYEKAYRTISNSKNDMMAVQSKHIKGLIAQYERGE